MLRYQRNPLNPFCLALSASYLLVPRIEGSIRLSQSVGIHGSEARPLGVLGRVFQGQLPRKSAQHAQLCGMWSKKGDSSQVGDGWVNVSIDKWEGGLMDS